MNRGDYPLRKRLTVKRAVSTLKKIQIAYPLAVDLVLLPTTGTAYHISWPAKISFSSTYLVK